MQKKGFTLVELIVVIILVGAVGVLTVPALLNSGGSSKETIKTSKIEAIKMAAMNYVEDNINQYSYCNSLTNQNEIEKSCIIEIEKLIEDDYLDADKDKESIIDPTTDEEMKGLVLACYNMNTGAFSTEYYENIEDKELCAQTGVHTLALQDNSVAISYHDGIDFYTNIFSLGEYIGDFTLSKTEDNGVQFEIINNKQLHISYDKHNGIFNGDVVTASTTISRKFNTGETVEERSVTFIAYIYDKIDEESSQLSITIRPNDKLRELSNFKKDITLTCIQNNAYGCEINVDHFNAYFGYGNIENYEYINKYTLNNQITYKSQINEIEAKNQIIPNKTYRIYNTQDAPQGVLSLRDKSVLYINIVPSPKILTFDAQGGTVSPARKTVVYGDTYGKNGDLPVPVKTGYTFDGWYETTAYTKKIINTTTVEKVVDHTIYAKWIANKYTIAFDKNSSDATGSMSNLTNREYGVSYTLTTNSYTRTGYTFAGWNTKSDGSGASYANGASVKNLTATSNGTVTLYAQWTPIKYTISFQPNGGSGSMSNLTNREYGVSYTLTTSSYTRTGYTFAGWNTKSDGSGASYANGASVKNLTATSNGTVTLYAQWLPIKYTIAFNGNGSTSGSMSTLTNREYDKSYTLTSNAYLRTGYIFVGWNTKSDGSGASYANGASVKNLTATSNGTVTLYAQWTPIKYSVIFYGNGQNGGSTASMSKLEYGNNYNLTANGFVKTGYVFRNWNTKSNGSGTSYSDEGVIRDLATTSTTVYLYAQWDKIKYTISFNGNGANGGSMSNMANREYGIEYTLTPNTYTKTGYLFKGWNTAANGSGTSYANKAKVKNLSTTNGATVTLYAQWTDGKIGNIVRDSENCTPVSGSNNPCYFIGTQSNNYVHYINSNGVSRLFRMYYTDDNVVKMITYERYLPSAPYAVMGSWSGGCSNTGLLIYSYLGDSSNIRNMSGGYLNINNYDEDGIAYGQDFYINNNLRYISREFNGKIIYQGEPVLMETLLNNFYSKYMGGSNSKVFKSFSDLDPLGAKSRNVSLMTINEFEYVSGYKTNGTYSYSSAPTYAWLFDKGEGSIIATTSAGSFTIYNYVINGKTYQKIESTTKENGWDYSSNFTLMYYPVYPTVGVKPTAKITSGTGTYSDPYIMMESDQ